MARKDGKYDMKATFVIEYMNGERTTYTPGDSCKVDMGVLYIFQHLVKDGEEIRQMVAIIPMQHVKCLTVRYSEPENERKVTADESLQHPF